MTGAAYAVGFVLAQWEWGNWFTFSALIWIFLPYYMRTGLYTMPEFLERRYNVAARYLFAIFCVIGYVVSLIAGPLYAGGLALQTMFGMKKTVFNSVDFGVIVLSSCSTFSSLSTRRGHGCFSAPIAHYWG